MMTAQERWTTSRRLAGTMARWVGATALAALCLSAMPLAQQSRGHEQDGKAAGGVTLRANPVDLVLSLGIKDEVQQVWEGQITVSAGRVAGVTLDQGANNSTVEGNKFKVRAKRGQAGPNQQRQAAAKNAKAAAAEDGKPPKLNLIPAIMSIALDVPATAVVTVETSQGNFSVDLADLRPGDKRFFLERQASLEREDVATPLTGRATEDDFPVAVKGANETAWLAYVAYTPGPELIAERVLNGGFDALVPKNNGDQILLMRFDGKSWSPPLEVTGKGLDVWRPTIAVDGQGVVWVAWSEKVGENWDLYARRYTPPTIRTPGSWSDISRLTDDPNADLSPVATTDSEGRVWLAWQAFRNGSYDILASAAADGKLTAPMTVSTSKANDWSAAIAADGQGKVYVAWDTYEVGNYDVMLATISSGSSATTAVANSARFEARPFLTCDAQNRLWIAYEEGDEQWGKDYLSAEAYRKVGFEKNPGFALYTNRTVKLKCLDGGAWKQPEGALEAGLSEKCPHNRSLPRFAFDKAGGLWLTVRHHPPKGKQGEVWNSYVLRYNGKEWTKPRPLASSANLMDNRPALVAHGANLVVVYSGDHRNRTQDRGQDDLYMAELKAEGDTQQLALAPDVPPGPAEVENVHPNEMQDVQRMRDFRLSVGGKQVQLLRGEFHRHTEFSAHNDGDGLLEDTIRYALDAGRMDWMGNGDHDNGFGHEYMWWLIQKMFDMHTHPGFVGAMTYERSVKFPDGHRNVIMPRRGIRPLPRGDLQGTAETGTPDTKFLYAYLKHFGGMCASHTSGTDMGTDWRDNDPDVEPVVEIYQGHRHNYEHFGAPRSATAETQIGGYQPSGFIWNALERGYRLGFESSSDHVSTHISYGVLFVEEPSRQGIIDAFKRRHCYAATDNILLVVRCGEQLMGDSFTTDQRPTLSIEATGTAPIAKFHVVRDNKYIYTAEPNEQQVRRTFTDAEAKAGQTSYYYVRVEQTDGNLAWASPMWITYKP